MSQMQSRTAYIRTMRRLSPAERIIAAVKRAGEVRDAAHARIDAEYVERLRELVKDAVDDEQTESAPTAEAAAANA
jgi:hypothetical protein